MEHKTNKGTWRQFIADSFASTTPIFIITENDDWYSGHIAQEPGEFFFFVLDKATRKPEKVFYSLIRVCKEFKGDTSVLQLPPSQQATSKHSNTSPADTPPQQDRGEE